VTSVFSRIIAGEIPGRFAYADETCVVFSTIEPITPGHMLVVPRAEVPSFAEAPDDLLAHLAVVAKRIGQALEAAYPGTRAVLMIAGFDVPHLHLHAFAVRGQGEMSFANAHPANGDELDAACDAVRQALRDLGYGDAVPAERGVL